MYKEKKKLCETEAMNCGKESITTHGRDNARLYYDLKLP